jgi:uncharacterized protein YkwD
MHGRIAALAMTALALAGLGGTGTGDGGSAVATPAPPPAGEVERALLAEMNRARARHDRPALRTIATLARPARAHSRVLLGRGLLTHDSPDGSPFWERLVDAGFPRNRAMAENLAMVPGCDAARVARQTVGMWLGSPGHRANLLNGRYRWAGSGAAISRDCRTVVITADYGS